MSDFEIGMARRGDKTETTLDSLLVNGDNGDLPMKVFIGHNLGNRTCLLTARMYEFFRMSQVANERGPNGEPIAQRKLDPDHALKLGQYVLRGLVSASIKRRTQDGRGTTDAYMRIQQNLGKQDYLSLQPIVANLRTCKADGTGLRADQLFSTSNEAVAIKLWLSQKDIFWVVDGQHRRKGMELVFEFLDDVISTHKYPKRKPSLYVAGPVNGDVSPEELLVWTECMEVARAWCTVSVELHLGLEIDEERQLFHDLNRLGKRVDPNLALEFDSSNPVNAFIKESLIKPDGGLLKVVNESPQNWQDDTGAISRKDLVAVNAHLFLNKSNINGAVPALVLPRQAVAKRFWEAVAAIPHFGEDGAKLRTVAAQPVVLKALAKLTYDFAFSRNPDEQLLARLLDGLTDIDFAHENPMWRYYDFTPEQRLDLGLAGLDRYMPSDDQGRNRDLGGFDPIAKIMRFGTRHNDIFPILGDMIRWRLGLPMRKNRASDEDAS